MGLERLTDRLAGHRLHSPLRAGWRAVRSTVRSLEASAVAQLGSCRLEPADRRFGIRVGLWFVVCRTPGCRCGRGHLRSGGELSHRRSLPSGTARPCPFSLHAGAADRQFPGLVCERPCRSRIRLENGVLRGRPSRFDPFCAGNARIRSAARRFRERAAGGTATPRFALLVGFEDSHDSLDHHHWRPV